MELPVGQILCGDCLPILRAWPDGCVDLVVTDPPYGIEYISNYYKYQNPHGEIEGDDKLAWGMDEWWRLTADGGAVFSFHSHKEPPRDERIRNTIIWVKQNWTAGDLNGDFGNQYECIAFAPKDDFHLRGNRWSNVWQFDRVQPLHHPTEKPVNLIERIIESATDEGGLVLDPYCGSGTTCLAAKRLGRRWIGIDISEKYCAIARDRLAAQAEPMFK